MFASTWGNPEIGGGDKFLGSYNSLMPQASPASPSGAMGGMGGGMGGMGGGAQRSLKPLRPIFLLRLSLLGFLDSNSGKPALRL